MEDRNLKIEKPLVVYESKHELYPDLFPARRNAARKPKAKVRWEDPGEPFDGYQGFLVRTALIRSNEYSDKDPPRINSSNDVVQICKYLATEDQENMVVLCVNRANALMAIHRVAIGPANSAGASIHSMVRAALLTGASGIILVHNHPSGSVTPSEDDMNMTISLVQACMCISISVLDHIIIGASGTLLKHFSFLDADRMPGRPPR